MSYTVLRIKRKATEPPLSSLVISPDDNNGRARKRRDVRGRGVFRLAETVPQTWQGVGLEGDALKTRIEGLLANQSPAISPSTAKPSLFAAGTSAAPAGPSSLPAPTPLSNLPPLSPFAHPPQPHAPAPGPAPSPSPFVPTAPTTPAQAQFGLNTQPAISSPLAARDPKVSSGSGPSTLAPTPRTAPPRRPSTQYRVVPRAAIPRQDPNLPPRVITLAEIEAAKSALFLVDCESVPNAQSRPGGQTPVVESEDPEMAAFLPMLNEYLKIEGAKSSALPPPSKRIMEDEDEDEYVYDLYYRDLRDDATLLAAGEGGVGALLGYDDLSPPSTPPDSEPEDEADEDSNDEDYYRNDYPEDEDADEDMEGFEDAYSDGAWSASDGEVASEEEQGGVWDYR